MPSLLAPPWACRPGWSASCGARRRSTCSRCGEHYETLAVEQEVVQAYGTSDMVVLALVERARVAVGGLPVQDWALRVTLVYRRDGADWLLVHRHADPLGRRRHAARGRRARAPRARGRALTMLVHGR